MSRLVSTLSQIPASWLHAFESMPSAPTLAGATSDNPIARLLVSDDTRGIQQLYDVLLPRYGFEVMTVPGGNGDTTLELCHSYRPDLLISDVNKPGLSGHAICKALRTEPTLADTPVLMISAMDGWLERQRGYTIMADDYLVKPFELELLTYRLIALLGLARGKLERIAMLTCDEPGFDYLHPVTGFPGPQALVRAIPRLTDASGWAVRVLRIAGFERLVRIYGRTRADDLLGHLATALRSLAGTYGEERLFVAHPGYDWRIALIGEAGAIEEAITTLRRRFARILRRCLPYEALERRAIFYRDRRGLTRTAPLPLLIITGIGACQTPLTLADIWRIA